MLSVLTAELGKLYLQQRDLIAQRLGEFSQVTEDQWFYELCFCLCTPQSSAVHAFAVQQALMEMRFLDFGQDVVGLLREPSNYIRFHNTKHARLHDARENWQAIKSVINDNAVSERDRRDTLASMVRGIGMKEASHYLRNIGRRGLAILDRHLLTNLVVCGVYSSVPSISTVPKYRAVEQAFIEYALDVGIDMDELDLLFWCAQTGHILK